MSLSPEELDKEKDVVQMIRGEESALSATLYCTAKVKETIDLYGESIAIYSTFHYPDFIKLHKEALNRGVRIRIITEITKDNLPYIKDSLQFASEVRHMDTITHTFGVSEKHYVSSKLQFGNPSFTQSIFSNVGWFVREQQYLFETLWKKAIPLKQRIREIEEGHKREFVDTVRDPTEVLSLLPNIISSAYEEIILFFPNSNTLRGFELAGLAESIKNQTQKNSNVRIKLLLKREGVESDEENTHHHYYYQHHRHEQHGEKHLSSQVKSSSGSDKLIGQNNVEVKFADPDKIDTNTALVIADGEKMLAIEFDDEEVEEDNYYSSPLQPNLTDRIRFASHTNSESAIMSYISIFERLWIESEMKQR